MRFKVYLTEEAQKELNSLSKEFTAEAEADYKIIENIGLENVDRKQLQKGLYEIRSGQIRSLYGYRRGQRIIVAVVFLKKTQKTHPKYINLALRRLQDYD
jgi:phage-related protein